MNMGKMGLLSSLQEFDIYSSSSDLFLSINCSCKEYSYARLKVDN